VRIGTTWQCLLALGLAACAAPSSPGGYPAGAAPAPPAAPAAPAAAVLSAQSLAATRWMGVIDASIDKRFAPWLEFVAEGRISGYTGCNLLYGTWKSDGGEMRIVSLVTTKRACAGPEQAIERRFVAALNAQSRVAREGDNLVFTTPAGERVEFTEVR
jgi:heat shock protein HslJ